MTTAELIAEMSRKPDPYLIVEWLGEQTEDVPAADARAVADAYFAALDAQ